MSLANSLFAEFPSGQNDVVMTLLDPLTFDAVAITSAICPEATGTGVYVWNLGNITILPTGYKEYIWSMADGATKNGGVVKLLNGIPFEITQMEMYQRMDLDVNVQNQYADDGSVISNSATVLTKTDNGDGTFDVVRSSP